MKNRIPKIFSIVILILFSLSSCKKSGSGDDTGPIIIDPVYGPQLTKISLVNSAGVESPLLDLKYNTSGMVSGATYIGLNWTVNYNTNLQLISVNGTNGSGGNINTTVEYNAGGQISKITITSNIPGSPNNTQTFSYDAKGSPIKITSVPTDTSIPTNVIDYTWNGNNLISSKQSINTYSTTYSAYDNKYNPFYLLGTLSYIFMGIIPTTNNATDIIINNANGTTVLQKVNLQYQSNNFPTSMINTGAANSYKFYYK